MALVNRVDPIRIDIPHEPGQWIKIRPLTSGELREANRTASARGMAMLDNVPENVLDVIFKYRNPMDADEDDNDSFDELTILRYSILEWSYEEEVEGNIVNLDWRTSRYLFEKVMDRTRIDEAEGKGLAAS